MKNNPYKGRIIEFHILQSFPVSCLNRDDVGSPKSAIVGGVNRARVSSQCWKRAVRTAMQDFDCTRGIRTKKISQYLQEKLLTIGAIQEQAEQWSKAIETFFDVSENTLHFFSTYDLEEYINYAKEKDFSLEYIKLVADKKAKDKKNDTDDKKEKTIQLSEAASKELKDRLTGMNNLDIALFGRMVAKVAQLNIEAASSFSHAISTHKVNSEVDFFTALDDLETQQGSAHLGSLEFNSATYYRYISLNLGQLYTNLGSNAHYLPQSVEIFIKALFTAVPSARQTTQSAASPWGFAKIFLRSGQRLQATFDKPIKAKDDGFLEPSIKDLKEYLTKQKNGWGKLFYLENEWTYEDGYTVDNLLHDIKTAIEV